MLNTSGLMTRSLRTLRQRGSRRFVGDILMFLTENVLARRTKPLFAGRTLEEDDLAEICQREETFFEYYDQEQSHTLELPATPNGYPEEVRERLAANYASGMDVDAPYVCELIDVELLGPDAVALKDGRFVLENSLGSEWRLATSWILALGEGTLPRQSRSRRPAERVDAALSLVGPWAGNYTHWFQDYLTRLEGLERYRSRTGVEPQVIVPADASQWMLESLRAMDYGPETWIMWDGGRCSVDRFVVSAVRREAHDRAVERRILYSPAGIRWVRDCIFENVEPETTRHHSPRIFISRGNAATRRLVNETAAMDLLSEWGFVKYRPEELSFAEQVTLFSNADAIVSTHGSGLMNQIFADDATVIEIFGPKQSVERPATEYYNAELLGHEYGCIQGRSVGPDVLVDLNDLETLLGRLLEQ